MYKTVFCLYFVLIEVLAWSLHFERFGIQSYKRLCYFTTWVYWVFVLTWLTDTICMIKQNHEENAGCYYDFPTSHWLQKGSSVSLALASISYPMSFLVSFVYWVAIVDWEDEDFKSFWWSLLIVTEHLLIVGCNVFQYKQI